MAALLARWWFPPTDLDNLLRWAGILFGAGLVVSATRSLTDGPALLLIAIGARQLERGRTWAAAVVLGLAGLVRETSVLCAAAFWPSESRQPGEPLWRARRRALLATLVCVGPIALWTAILFAHYGRIGGLRNIAPPFVALAGKARELAGAWRTRGLDRAMRDELLVAATLAVQIGFLIARPQPREPWWRIGASFAAFAAFLGWPVWEGFPSAAARALLPISLAFNRLVPRTRRGLLLLALGNLGLLALPDLLDSIVPTEQVAFADGIGARYGGRVAGARARRARHLALGLRHGDAHARQPQRRRARGDARLPAAFGLGAVGDGVGRNQPANYRPFHAIARSHGAGSRRSVDPSARQNRRRLFDRLAPLDRARTKSSPARVFRSPASSKRCSGTVTAIALTNINVVFLLRVRTLLVTRWIEWALITPIHPQFSCVEGF